MATIKTNIDPSLLLKYPQCKVHPELVTEIHKTDGEKKKMDSVDYNIPR